mmetsp:Transcript_19394/g.42360  ORF Transcript_19394/g.42360 Transcript_19394/m.42360 type:complete len:278 (+) Transcript_19394:16-849(+)
MDGPATATAVPAGMDDAAAMANPMRSMVLEVVNAVLLSSALTEFLLPRSRRRSAWWRSPSAAIHLAVFILLNLALSSRIHGVLFAALPSIATDNEVVHAVGDSDISSPITAHRGGGELPEVAQASIVEEGSIVSSLAYLVPFLCGLTRLTAVMAGFSALAYFDVRHLRQQPYTLWAFQRELRAAVRLVIPVFPFLVVGFSCIFLVFEKILEKVGLPAAIGEDIVFYGQFYAPLGTVYWIIKKDWLTGNHEEPPLPLHGQTSSPARGNRRAGAAGAAK